MTANQPDMDDPRPGRLRKLGVVLFVFVLLLTLLGIFHLIENWRGKAKWEGLKRELIAQGEQLDLAAFVPPPIPPEQNFAATPFFAELFPGPKPTNWNSQHWPETFTRLNPPTPPGKGSRRHVTDMIAWQNAIRGTNSVPDSAKQERAQAAEEVLAALKPYEPALREMRAAAGRPLSRYDVLYTMDNPWGIRLPHLPALKETTRLLSIKACAELAAGKSERALEDVQLMARLVHSMDSELFLINYLVEVACFQLMMQPVWEGLALGLWSDAQLQELQDTLMQFNFVAQLATPLKGERAAGILTVDILMQQRYKVEFLEALTGQQGGSIGIRNALAFLVPRGWYRMEQYEYTRLAQQFVLPGADGTNRLVHPAVINRNQVQLEKALPEGWRSLFRHRMIARLLMPGVAKVHRRAAEAQTAAHQAAIACALERYRRKRGQYPAEIAALAPELMAAVPRDVIGGRPMGYKPGKPFALYSVGWDEKDNGGTPGKTLWDEQGDWVWTYPQ